MSEVCLMSATTVAKRLGCGVRSCRCSVLYGRSPWKRPMLSKRIDKQLLWIAFVLSGLLCTGASRPSPNRQQPRIAAASVYDIPDDASRQQHLSTGILSRLGLAPFTGPDTPAAAAAAGSVAASTTPRGRTLKQAGVYDPYGYGYYDPYTAGVTPGFVNVDVNRETGLHVDVGHVAVDVSADKNYVGLGLGNLVGIGAARDRGWNLQVAGGNVLDASVTKDAGLGLWVLDGLVNVNIGPEGIFKNARPGNIAARTAGAAAPAQIQSVTVDDTPVQTAALPQQQQQQQVVYPTGQPGSSSGMQEVSVEDPAAVVAQQQQQQQSHQGATEPNPPMYTTDASEVNQIYSQNPSNESSSPAAAAPAEAQLPSYDFMDLLAYDPASDAAANDTTSRSRLAAPTEAAQPTYSAQAYRPNMPQAYSGLGANTVAASAAAAPARPAAVAGGSYQSYLIARPGTPPPTAAPPASSRAAARPPAGSTYQSYMVSRPAAAAAAQSPAAAAPGIQQDDQWTVASQYSDTQQMAAARLAAMTATVRPSPPQQPHGSSLTPIAHATKQPQQQWLYQQQPNLYDPQQQQQQQPTTPQITHEGGSDSSASIPDSSGSSRRACDGGVQIWVTGSKFKCKYKRAEPEVSAAPAGPLKVASGQYTYTNGVAV